MSESRLCGNPDVLMSYLYEDGDESERLAFEAHLTVCAECAREVREIRALRAGLANWAPPDQVLGFRVVRETAPSPPRRNWLRVPSLPLWAQLAAASLIVGVAAGLAGLDVRYDAQGFAVRTGWGKPADVATGPGTAPIAVAPASGGEAPWQADLVALGEELRAELRERNRLVPAGDVVPASAGPARAMSDSEFLARMQELVEASEQRQQRELALRLSEIMRDVETQRRVDLARVANSLGAVEGRTGLAVAEQRDMLNYLMRVSSREQR